MFEVHKHGVTDHVFIGPFIGPCVHSCTKDCSEVIAISIHHMGPCVQQYF